MGMGLFGGTFCDQCSSFLVKVVFFFLSKSSMRILIDDNSKWATLVVVVYQHSGPTLGPVKLSFIRQDSCP